MQAMGAITPAMTAGMAFLLLGTLELPLTYATLIPVMMGIVLSAGFEPSFHGFGFMASMGASGARAFKAVLQVIETLSSLLVFDVKPYPIPCPRSLSCAVCHVTRVHNVNGFLQ